MCVGDRIDMRGFTWTYNTKLSFLQKYKSLHRQQKKHKVSLSNIFPNSVVKNNCGTFFTGPKTILLPLGFLCNLCWANRADPSVDPEVSVGTISFPLCKIILFFFFPPVKKTMPFLNIHLLDTFFFFTSSNFACFVFSLFQLLESWRSQFQVRKSQLPF